MEEIELQPDAALQEKIAFWTHKRASFTSIAVVLYIIGAAILIGYPAITAVSANWVSGNPISESSDVARAGVIGFIGCLVCIAIATGLLVYINMSMPHDVASFMGKKNSNATSADIPGDSTGARLARTWLGSHMPICVIVYFVISFTTGAWHITWLVFLIDMALVNAIKSFFGDGKGDGSRE